MTEVQQLIDSLEADLDRMRALDPALKASMLARLDALRKLVL
jgi:hypothetical protein